MSNGGPSRLSAALSGRYRIERRLGEGGMATVYLAEDLRHDRRVALKVLKPELAAVVGAERFLAEIRTTANLQHPHILPLFDSGEADGFLFYVMPYVGGETLHDRLERDRQLPVDEAVRVASAVAGALDYAHRQGVVHRDIKPANILFQDGQPVVSDFGIALAVGAGSGARLTETGLSVGTPFYMSPEQATGDARVGPPSDVYALGCVLYEMLVGEPPYTGSTAQAVLGKILTGAAAAPRDVRPAIPVHVDAAIRRALEKVPADRFATGRDFAAALADTGFRHGEDAAGAGTRTGRPGLWNPLSASVTGLALVLALALGWQRLRPEPPAALTNLEVRFSGPSRGDGPTGPRSGGGTPTDFDLAPDGSFVVYSERTRFFLQRWSSREPERITAGNELVGPRVSPDGQAALGFDGGIGEMVVRSLAGAPDDNSVATAADGAWGDDGALYVLLRDTLWRRSAPGEALQPVVAPFRGTRGELSELEVPPGGRGILATQPGTSLGEAIVEAVSLPDGRATTLVQGMTPRVAPSGHLLYARADGMLMAAPFDPSSLTLTGAPVATGRTVTIRDGKALFSVDGRGTLLYRSGGAGTGIPGLVRMWPDGRREALPGSGLGENVEAFDLSPDGTRLAFRTRAVNRDAGVWVKALPDGPLTRVYMQGSGGSVFWAPDGAWVTFSAGEDLWRAAADGSRPPERFLDLERPISEGFVLADGSVVVRTWPTGKDRDILVLRPGDSVPRDIFPSEATQMAPSVSPDGRWIAYASSESGVMEFFVQPFPAGEGRVQVSTGVGGVLAAGRDRVRWGRDSRTLYFLDDSEAIVSVDLASEGGALRASRPRTVLRPPQGMRWLGMFPDGSFLFAEEVTLEGSMTLVLNFTEELKALVPR